MLRMYDTIPGYLVGKSELVLTVTFSAFFSLAAMLVSAPFSHNAWFELENSQAFWFAAAFFCIALALVAASRCFMYRTGNKISLCWVHYIIWCVLEVVGICILYTFFTLEGEKFGILELEDSAFERIFLKSLLFGFVSLGVPYVLSAMYLALQDKDKTISLMNYSGMVSDMSVSHLEERRITLCDNSGVMKFSVKQSNLCFIEADDNYIQVWYQDASGAMKQYMLRCRLKTVENSFADSDLVRCHRKYIVNINKVSVLSCRKEGYFLDMDLEGVDPIPVSRTYESAVLERFNSR